MTERPLPSNQEVAEVLRQIAEYLEMQKVLFKPRAYQRAAQTIAALEAPVAGTYAQGGRKALMEIPGVGAGIADKLEEFLKTGRIKEYEALKKETPVRLDELSRIEGLGPKSIQKLYQELGVRNLKELEAAARAGKIAALEGFGKKSEEKILKGIGFAAESGTRFILGYALPQIEAIAARLRKVRGVETVTIAGSSRRRRDTIGDADLLAVTKEPEAVMESFVAMPEVLSVIAHGPTKSSVKVRPGINIDLRVVPRESYGATLNYFTGSKAHNVAMRQIAMRRGGKLNEYGLFDRRGKAIAGASEQDIYQALGMDYVEPELREDTGEIAAAARHALPKLIPYGSLMGDLQTQTDWTDGEDSIEAMARGAMARGLHYLVITDHTKRLAMTHGLDEARLLKQMAEIDRLNRKLAGKIRILKGSECDILKDGSLDLPDRALAKLDVVGISVHSHFNLPRAEQTARVKRAMANPHADILFHPTARLINRRPPIELDMDEIIRHAKNTGTVLEVNALPERADLKDEYIRAAIAAGVKLSIDSDAHAVAHFDLLDYGIAQARRGWATKGDIVNAWPLAKMRAQLKQG